MAKVEMYSSRFCPYCVAARRMLDGKGVEYEVHGVDLRRGVRQEMQQRSGRHTVPQVFIDGEHIGGFDDLAALDAEDRLDPLLGLA